MKVLIAVDSIPYTSETFVLNHIKGLIDAKIDVKVCAFNKPDEQKIHQIFYDYNLEELIFYKPKLPENIIFRICKGVRLFFKCVLIYPYSTVQSLNFIKYGLKALKLIYLYEMSVFVSKEKYDLIHCHFGTMAKKVSFYQGLGILKAPLVTTFHGYDVDDKLIRADKMFYSDLQKKGVLFFVNSEYTRRRVVSLGFDNNKIKTVPVSLDTTLFKNNELNTFPRSIHKKIITVARLVEFKGIEYCIKAIKIVNEKTEINFRYTIIGDGPLKYQLEALVNDLNLTDVIEILGSKDQAEIKEYLSSADLFLLTGIMSSDGRQENQGLVIQEAQAMELPVIVSNIGGVSEGVIDGKTGFLVEPKNIQQISDKILLLLTDDNLRIQMGKRGRMYVVDKYSIENITKSLINSYNQIIA